MNFPFSATPVETYNESQLYIEVFIIYFNLIQELFGCILIAEIQRTDPEIFFSNSDLHTEFM